jgi:hypothetical protein
VRGRNCVWGQRRVPVPGWPGQQGSVPSGLSRSLTAAPARKLHVPSQRRRALAREIVDFVAVPLPARRMRVLGEGG